MGPRAAPNPKPTVSAFKRSVRSSSRKIVALFAIDLRLESRVAFDVVSNPIACSNCGAMMAPDDLGRTYSCRYCSTRVQVGIAGAQIAAGMQLDLANVDNFLSHLANTLSQGFAEHTRIEANGRYVIAIEVNIEPDLFSARREGERVAAQHKRVVRGIALKTSTLQLDLWVEKLTDSLARHANSNARAAWVLSRLGGGRR
jgi:hypothetical protein